MALDADPAVADTSGATPGRRSGWGADDVLCGSIGPTHSSDRARRCRCPWSHHALRLRERPAAIVLKCTGSNGSTVAVPILLRTRGVTAARLGCGTWRAPCDTDSSAPSRSSGSFEA